LGLIAKHLDVQIALLMTPEFSGGLPGSLVGDPACNTSVGLKALQLAANSIMPLLTFLGSPVADRFPTHAEQFNQNINSQSYLAAMLARESIRVSRHYLSISLLVAIQAADLRAYDVVGSYDARKVLAPATRRLYEAVRNLTGCPPNDERPFIWDDRGQQLDQQANILEADLRAGQEISNALGVELRP
jgi:phenylalanine ammonia-lyase